jgi:hypothetical protein
LAFPEPNLKLSDAQPFFCFKIPDPNLDKRDRRLNRKDEAAKEFAEFQNLKQAEERIGLMPPFERRE